MNSRQTTNQKAKSAALVAMEQLSVEATGLVKYQSRGRAVVIGDDRALEFAPRLHERLNTLLILTEGVEEPGVPLIPLGGRSLHIEGYLGNFKIHLGEAGKANAESVAADLAHRRLRLEQLLGRLGEAPLRGHREKHAQFCEIHWIIITSPY